MLNNHVYSDYDNYRGLRTKKLSLNNKVFWKAPVRYKGKIVRQKNFYSRFLNNSRDIDIYLPPTYGRNPNKRYPVLYMHDGNNLFYPSIAFAGVPWKVDSTMDKMINNGLIEEVIVVGIFNTIGRNDEYTWTQMRSYHGVEGGKGDLYAKFIVNELKPFIDRSFNTLSDRNNTAVMGSSLGGLISYYLGLYYPHVFGKIGMVSPSLWWDRGQAFKDIIAIQPNLQIWMDMGTKEGYSRNVEKNVNIMMVRYMKHQLQQLGYTEGINLGYLEDKGAKHNEYYWGKRLHLPLLFFFGKRKSLIFTRA